MRSVFCVLSAIETFSSEQPDSSGEVDAAVISVQSAAFASMGSASSCSLVSLEIILEDESYISYNYESFH